MAKQVSLWIWSFLLIKHKLSSRIRRSQTGGQPYRYTSLDRHLSIPRAFVDISGYVTNHHKTPFFAVCRTSVLICPWIQHHSCMQWQSLQLRPMSSPFLLDVYASIWLQIDSSSFSKMANSRPLLTHVCSFQATFTIQIVDFSGIRARVIGEDHYTTARLIIFALLYFCGIIFSIYVFNTMFAYCNHLSLYFRFIPLLFSVPSVTRKNHQMSIKVA